MIRLAASVLLALYITLLAVTAAAGHTDPPIEDTVAVEPPSRDRDLEQRATETKLRRQLQVARRTVTRQRRTLIKQRRLLVRRWRPTVNYSLRLASAVSGISYWQLRSVSWCESRHFPFATNGRYKGLFQLGWSPFGFSPFDPVANALSAALTVRHDGSWRQWACKP